MKQEKKIEELKKIMSRLKKWEARVPNYILKMTPKEIYVHGFDSGYNCKLHDIEEKEFRKRPLIEFKFIRGWNER